MPSTLMVGGARSGKSSWAIEYAKKFESRAYVATAKILDEEMAKRAENHQAERGPGWTTLEVDFDLASPVKSAAQDHEIVLLDCLTVWAGQSMEAHSDLEIINKGLAPLVEVIKEVEAHVILITNEVGQGIVPPNAAARRYRDLLGAVNQCCAEDCDNVVIFNVGIPWAIKGQVPK